MVVMLQDEDVVIETEIEEIEHVEHVLTKICQHF